MVFSIILDGLRGLGVRGTCLKWFESYLRGRKLSVCTEHKKSNIVNITFGVPQGSVLGPLLYLIYVDSMRFYVVGLLTSFADDTAILVNSKTVQELVDNANNALRGQHSFVSESLLAVNAKKTNYIIFKRTGTHGELPHPITFNGVKIDRMEETRYLVFVIDCNLSWKKHSDIVSSKVSRGVGILRRFKNVFPTSVIIMLYHSLIPPYIYYGCSLWISNFYGNFKKVQIQKNKALRAIGKYERGVVSTESIFRKFGILNAGQTRDYQIGTLVHQCLNNIGPKVFSDLFKRSAFYHEYDTRNAEVLANQERNDARSGFTIKHMGPTVWNSILWVIQSAVSLPQFKARLKKHFLTDQR